MSLIAVALAAGLVVAGCGGGSNNGATEALGPGVMADVPQWINAEKLPPAALPGARLFAIAGCLACHTYLDSGSAALHAPDLTAIGRRNLGIDFETSHLACPSCTVPGSLMPKFGSLGRKRLRALAVFLESSKGKR